MASSGWTTASEVGIGGGIGEEIGNGVGARGITGVFGCDDDTCVVDDNLLQSFESASSLCFAISVTCVLELDCSFDSSTFFNGTSVVDFCFSNEEE